ncbi:MAG: PLP-dependent transferase [Betaproteobacteria bacterium]|nr:PLP-dependent transferase [Betaproteobacteria bacterium]
MTSSIEFAPASQLQHVGAEHRVGRGLVGALEQSVTFSTERIDELPVYARLSNTHNHAEVCSVIAALHCADEALVFSSGIAAIHAVMTSLLQPGDHILVQENCYGATQGLCQKILARWGIESTFAPLEEWHKHLRSNTRVLFYETISNPYCIVQDVRLALQAKRTSGALLVCDNTFASPINCTPLVEGVDVVVESATKYLNGHSDLVCGAVACQRSLAEQIAAQAMYVGGFLSTTGCMQLLKGMRTLNVRMQAHNETGRIFAARAAELAGVERVYHGSLQAESFPWMRGYSGMLAIRFAAQVDVPRLMRCLKMVSDVPSLGGTETTACLPWWTTNRWMSDAEKHALGIDEQLVRLSLGLENVDDLLSDLRAALARSEC